MAEIKLTDGQAALVDDEDFIDISKYRWCYKPKRLGNAKGDGYACRWGEGNRRIFMHRQLVGEKEGREIDHINGNGLDNRRSNLRFVTHSENMLNMKKTRSNTSGFKGVHLHKKSGKWRARVSMNGKKIHLGLFDSAEEASAAYNNGKLCNRPREEDEA